MRMERRVTQGFSSGNTWYRSALWALVRARARRLLFAYAAVILGAVALVKLYEAAPAEQPRPVESTALPATPQRLVVAPSPTPTRAPSTVTPHPTATTAPAPTLRPPTSTPTADQAWSSLDAGVLGPLWNGKEWPNVVNALQAFLSTHPDHPAAKQKLYAALYNHGTQLIEQGKTDEGVEALIAADRVAPDRTEARAALRRLTPTPVPSTPTPVPPTPAPRPQPAPAAAPAPISRPTQPPRCQITLEASATNVLLNTYVTFIAKANRVLPKLAISWGWQDGSSCENCSTHTYRYNYQNYVGTLNFTGIGIRDKYVVMTECSTQTVRVTWYSPRR